MITFPTTEMFQLVLLLKMPIFSPSQKENKKKVQGSVCSTDFTKGKSNMEFKRPAAENNCNSLPISEKDLLAKLEAANKLIESDAKSLNSLQSTHSRRNSDTSQISLNSSKNH